MSARKAMVAVWLVCALALSSATVGAQSLEPLRYTIRFPDTASKSFAVEVVVPTGKRPSVELMMAVWSPGFYGLQNYSDRVTSLTASTSAGVTLEVTKPQPSRWRVQTGGASTVTVSYTVSAPRGSNLSNGVTETGAVLIGPPTYITMVEPGAAAGKPVHRPADVTLVLPASWKGAATALDTAPDGKPNHYVAPDYDVLADSPILAGEDLAVTRFTVGGITHDWVYLGKGEWAGDRVAAALTPLIEEHIRFWGALPYTRYAFLNIVTERGGSGVEHLNSVAITGGGKEPTDQAGRFRYASFLSHEYFHAMNVKRLRPVELGPFDYEHAPVTTGLWVAEGLTTYYGELLAARSGAGTVDDYLATMSRHISDLQNAPGRLVQTIQQASAQMFENLPREKKVDYYVKGPIVGLVLDAHIRKATGGRRSLDDVMRLAYRRYAGERGFTEAQFDRTVSDAAGVDVSAVLNALVATSLEVDYAEMLDWFGLRFATGDPAKVWQLEVRPDATAAQRQHLTDLLARSASGR